MPKKTIIESTLIESALLKALSVREHYNSYLQCVNTKRIQEVTQVLLECYEEYYKLYPKHKEIDFGTFVTQFSSNWHQKDMTTDVMDFYLQVIKNIANSPIEDAEIALMGLVNKQFIDKINEIPDKNFNSETIRQALQEYEYAVTTITSDFDQDIVTIDNVDLSKADKSLGMPYFCEPLNNSLEGMIQGSLVIINAATSLGKSALVHTQADCSVRYLDDLGLDGCVLFLTTEDSDEMVWLRQLSCHYRNKVSGIREIRANQDRFKNHYLKKYGKYRFMVGTANHCGVGFIRSKIKKYKPALVILDMAKHMVTSTGKAASDVYNVEAFFNSLKQLTNEYCPIIATVQAGAGAMFWHKETQKQLYKEWPTHDDIYGSKTAVQSAAETIITVGRNNIDEDIRYLQTTKLKSEMPKAKFMCKVDFKHNYYEVIRDLSYIHNQESDDDDKEI